MLKMIANSMKLVAPLTQHQVVQSKVKTYKDTRTDILMSYKKT